jgi:serine/threonine protein kinase
MEGGSLRSNLARVRSDPALRRRTLTQVAEALVCLHGHGLAHLDIKPENVLFFDDLLNCAKLCDFGLASQTGGVTAAATAAPASPSVLHSAFPGAGTVSYMAPEVVEQAQLASEGRPVPADLMTTQRADVFGLGVMAIELNTTMSAQLIYTQATGSASARSRLAASMAHAGVSVALVELLMQCVAVEAVERPAAADLYAKLVTLAASG